MARRNVRTGLLRYCLLVLGMDVEGVFIFARASALTPLEFTLISQRK